MKTTLKDLTAVKENSYFVIETPENTFRIKKEYDDTADSPPRWFGGKSRHDGLLAPLLHAG